MGKLSAVALILMILVSFGCNNPKGGSSIAQDHTPLLQPPGNFSFSLIRAADGNVQITWNPSSRVDTYQFFMGTDPTNITTPVSSCSGDDAVTSCELTGLTETTLYYFTVKATNAAGSKSSGQGRALSVDSAGFDVTGATPSDGTITYTWTPAAAQVTSYNLIYGTVPGSYPNTKTNITSPYTLTGLTNGVRYYARIVAVNNDNGYAVSPTESNAQPFGPLGPPQSLAATPAPGSVSLDWADLSGASSYEIWDGTGTTLLGTSVTSDFTHSHGADGVTYTYKVRALNGFNGAFSTTVSARSISAFTMISAVAGPLPGQVTVTWPTPVTGAATYNIRYGSNPLALNLSVTNVTSPYVFSGLVGGLTYYFHVDAVNAVGAGAVRPSDNQLSATPVAPISPPTGVSASATPSAVTLSWNAVAGATEYHVYRNTASGGHTYLGNAGLSTSYVDNTATPNGSTYYYVVRSYNGLESANSSEVSKTPIANFSFTSATVATFASADLVWGSAAGASGYDILYGTTSGSYGSVSLNRTSPTTLTSLSPSTTYYVVIRAKNSTGGGTTLLSNELTFTTGTLYPTVTISSAPLINNANKASYPVSGTCSEEGRSVGVNVGGATASTTCTSLAWSLSMDVTAAADSPTRSVVATHTNSGGNSDTDTVSVVKDTVNPTVSITTYPAINNTNKSAYTVSGACSENTRTVSVSVGGITASPTCSSLAWTATLDVSALSDSGSVSVTADHTDAAGNTATQATRSVSKDTVPPSVAISSAPTINNANKASYPVSGTCSDTGENVVVKVGAVSSTVSCTLLSWSTTINVSAVADAGAVVVTADHSDAAGNAAAQASTLVLKDTVNPSVAITSSPTIISTNKNAYTVSGTCSENTRNVDVTVGGVTGTVSCSSAAWSATLDVSSVSDGPSISVSATHTDAALNSTTASTTVVKQTALPTVTISSNTAINNTNKSSYPVNGTCSHNGRPVTVSVGGVTATPTCTALAWTTSVNVGALADSGGVVITADHSDSVGNNAIQASTTVVKDTVIPTVAITSSPAINTANKTSYIVSGTCSENTRTVTVSVAGVGATPTCSGLAWSATVDVSAVADGAAKTITADHTDAAGNAATQASVTVVKDTALPTVTITSYPAINNSNKSSYTVSGACSENGQSVSVSVGGVTSSPTCTALAWSATLNVNSVSDGASVAITADHSDAAGNPATQANRSVVKDTVIPTVAITSSPVINNSNKASYTVSGTCSDSGESVSVAVGATTGSTTCSLLTWSVTLNVSANADSATLLVTADHTDAAGNAAVQAGVTVVKDTVNPTVAISSSPAINNANKTSYQVSGTCSENGLVVTVSVGGVTATPNCSALAWLATLDVSGVADSSSVSVTANHSDSAGNNATQASATVVKQTALPTVAITSSPVINNAIKTAYTVSGTCSVNTRAVTVSVGGVGATPTCSGSAWTATLNVTAVADNAAVSITADHDDAVGNNAVQATASVLKDTVNPTVAISSAPTINNANKSSYIVSGTCSENGRAVNVSVGGVTGTPNCTTGAWATTLNVTAVSDSGSVAVTANHTDLAGNAATPASTTVIKDTSNPTVAITASPVINVANKAAYTVSGTCSENGQTVSVSVGGVTGSPNCTTSTWTVTLNVTAVADNANVAITADHTDTNGNAATQATASVLKDTSNPTVAITSSPVINNANKGSYPVAGTCSEDGLTVTVTVGGVSATPNCSSNTWSTSLNVTSVSDGASVAVTADHSDAAGNAASQASTTVLKDTVLPTVAITSSPTINSVNATAYPISGTCSENTRTVTVNLGGVSATPNCSSGSWSASMNVSGVPDSGSVAVTADHSDAAGNNAVQATTSVSKATSLPTVAISSAPAINNTNKSSYPLSGTCSVNGQPVSVSVGGLTASPNCSGNAWSASINASGLSDSGSVSVTADHSDGVGNNAIQASTTVVKDTVIPTVTITSLPTINNTNKATYTIGGACSENTRTVSVSVGGVSGSANCSTLTWSATLNVTSVSDGASVAITADHADAAGNNATQATATVAKDTALPTVAITSAPSINNTNKSSYPVSGTCSENGQTVTVSVGGVGATPSCTTGSWSTSVNVSALSDSATVTVTANHSDVAGNAATQASTTVVKDTAIPTVAITSSPSINNANKTLYNISGTCSEGTRAVSVSVGGVSATPTCSGGTWSSTLDVSGISDSASVSATADHTDAAGNSATQATASILKDTVNPTVALDPPATINSANKAIYPVSGTCSENTRTVSISVGGVSGSATCTGLAFSTTVNVTAVGDGASISITADHTDAAGNTATQASRTTAKDTSAPTVAITSSGAINNSNKSTYPVSGTCSESGRSVTVSVGGVAATPNCSGGIWSTTVNVSGVSDGGTIAITADHSDAAGNSATQATSSVLKDTVAPTVSISVAATINNANKTNYIVSGACSENGKSVSVSVGGVSGSGTCLTLAWSATLNVTSVSDGASVSVTANHSDAAGNAATQASTTVLKDTSNPSVAITSSPVINNSNKTSYPVGGTCSEEGQTVTVSVGGVGATPSCSGGAWSTTVNASGLSDGSVTITADHSDTAGNSATQASISVTKDTTPPSVAITSNAAINNSNKTIYPVSGTCSENGRTVTVSVGGVGATPNCSLGAWSTTVNVSAVADSGAVSITADHTDANGNSATQASTTVLKDTIVPTVLISSAPIINNSNKTNYPVSGTCSENGRTVSVTVGTASATPSCSGGAWSTTINVSSVADSGSVSVTANHTDLAGNSATQASASVVKDTSDPTVAITSSGAINNANKASYPVSGTCSENGRTVTVSVSGVGGTPSCTAGNWSVTLDVSALADAGSVSITANHSDINGNSAPQASTTVLKDTIVPTVTISSAPAINNANKSSYPVSGTCSENGRTVSVSVGGVGGTSTCTALAWSASLNVSALADSGSVTVTANHTDAAGNPATQASTTVSKDTGIPTVAINSPSVINNANKTSYTVTGTCSETGRQVTVNVGSVNTSDTCTLLTWSVTVDVSGNPDSGTLLITADHTDAAGNSAVQAGTTVVKDTANPTVAIGSAPTIKVSNKTSYVVSGTCSENGRSVSISVGSVNASATCSGGAWTSSSLDVSSVPDSGSVSVSATHSDSAGNTATANTSVLKDATDPTVAITSAPSINIANVSSYTISGTCSENGRQVIVSSGAANVPTTCSAGAWSLTANVSSFSDSTSLLVTASHTDAVGNSASDSTSLLKDTVAPTVALSASVSSPTSSSSWTVRATFSEAVTGMALSDFVVGNGTPSGFTMVSSLVYDVTITPTSTGAVTVNMAASAAADAGGNPSTVASQLTTTYQDPAVLTFADATTYDFGTVAKGGSADVIMVINKSGTPNATSVTETSLSAPFAFKGGSYPGTGGTCGTTISGTCTIVVTFTPTANGSWNDFVTLQYNNGTSTVSASRAITGTGVVLTPVKIAVSGAGGVTTNQCIPYTITSLTSDNQQANVSAAQSISLVVNNGSGTFYSNSACSSSTSSTSIASGTSSKTIYFKTTTSGQNLTLVFNAASLSSTTKSITTSGGPTKIRVNVPAEFATSTCNPVVIDFVDNSGFKAGRSASLVVNLSATGNAVFYSDSVCTGAVSSVTFPATTETMTVYVKDATAQSSTLSYTAAGGVLTADSDAVTFVSSLTWWNTSYAKRMPITIDNSDQAVAHTNMPVLIRLNSSRVNYADFRSSGQDVRFTLADHTTTLSYDIESWDTNGDSLIWVKIPSLSASTSRIIYLYYDNPAASSGESSSGTWSGFSGVWNMEKSGSTYIDATGSGKDASAVGTVTDMTGGPTGASVYVNNSGIDTGYDLSQIIGRTSTLSFWIKTTQSGSNTVWQAPGVTGVEESGGGNDIFFGFIRGNGYIGIASGNGNNTTSNFLVNDGNWRFVTMSRNETNGAVRFYVNGVLNGNGNSDSGYKSTSFTAFGFIRDTGGASQFLNGELDGIRLNNSILSDDRIKAEYKYSVESHVSYGTSEDL